MTVTSSTLMMSLRAGGPELFVSPGESDDLGPFRNRPLDGVKPRLDEGRLEAVFLGEEGQARESCRRVPGLLRPS